jgi:hypothetical protein
MIADHTASDRNNDGWDSPAIWNDLMSTNTIKTNPFGITFTLNNFSETTSNRLSVTTNTILNGTQGVVTQLKYSAGASMTINTTANTSVKGLTWAMSPSNVQAYYKVITRINVDDVKIVEKIQLDANTYANTATSNIDYDLQDGSRITQIVSKETQSYYQYEIAVNDSKRTIKLLKPEFVTAVEKEFKKVIKA